MSQLVGERSRGLKVCGQNGARAASLWAKGTAYSELLRCLLEIHMLFKYSLSHLVSCASGLPLPGCFSCSPMGKSKTRPGEAAHRPDLLLRDDISCNFEATGVSSIRLRALAGQAASSSSKLQPLTLTACSSVGLGGRSCAVILCALTGAVILCDSTFYVSRNHINRSFLKTKNDCVCGNLR